MTDRNEFETYRFVIDRQHEGARADKALGELCDGLSRSRIQALIDEGQVSLNGLPLAAGKRKCEVGDVVVVEVPPAVPCDPLPEDMPLDIVFEDEHLIVLNKAAGMVVHPGAGNANGTLVNALLHYCGDTLSGIGGVIRPGIVHRLDKDTSGLMIVAKTDKAHQYLSHQLADRSLSRIYHAVVFKVPMPLKGVIEAPIGRHSSNRQKMAVHEGGREAITHYHVQKRFGEACSLVECKLSTGRTHQIRVHMAHLGYSLLGDPLYGPQSTGLRAALAKEGYLDEKIGKISSFSRQALHARAISFIHPETEKTMDFDVPYPDDFRKLLNLLDK